jgi:hypothetical protein
MEWSSAESKAAVHRHAARSVPSCTASCSTLTLMDRGLAGLLIISVSHHPRVGLRVCNTPNVWSLSFAVGPPSRFRCSQSIVDVIPLPRRPRCRRCESARKRQAQTPGKHRCLGHAARRRRLREPAYSRSTPARNLVSTRLPLSVKKMLSTTHM